MTAIARSTQPTQRPDYAALRAISGPAETGSQPAVRLLPPPPLPHPRPLRQGEP